jgi:hypothetical protein
MLITYQHDRKNFHTPDFEFFVPENEPVTVVSRTLVTVFYFPETKALCHH